MTIDEEDTAHSSKMSRRERIKRTLASTIGYIIPLMMSSPGLYAGLMTIPFVAYLLLNFGSFEAISYLFLGGSILENIILTLGLMFFLYSVVFLWRTKSKGLVTSGPYRIVRHPQYFSLILFTAVLTSRSVWVLLNTFGGGFLGPWETIAVWFIMVLAYNGLAVFEERHLMNLYHAEWSDYSKRAGFLIPFITNKRKWLELAVSLIILTGFMLSLLIFNDTLWWFF